MKIYAYLFALATVFLLLAHPCRADDQAAQQPEDTATKDAEQANEATDSTQGVDQWGYGHYYPMPYYPQYYPSYYPYYYPSYYPYYYPRRRFYRRRFYGRRYW